ncbi:MAG: Gfo/Idh/MocA family protein, partial [Gammaproteobacteria bacterium]
CMRFWPDWVWLKDRIDDQTFGQCTGLTLTRIGSVPSWSQAFYGDASRCGGALCDLHIHDADFVRYCFGDPSRVFSAGTINHVTTVYQFTEIKGRVPFDLKGTAPFISPHVVAEGAWLPPGTPFTMRYRCAFQHATADFDAAREPQLLLYRVGQAESVQVSTLTGYDQEIRHVVHAIARRNHKLRATLGAAAAVAELLEAERRSIEQGSIVEIQSDGGSD